MNHCVVPYPGMIIKEDTVFLPGVYHFFENQGITIQGSHINIDGNGAVFIGGKPKTTSMQVTSKEEFAYDYKSRMKNDALGYHGIAFYSEGTDHVVLKNITAKNFEIGLKLINVTEWHIEANDFSYNYYNMDHGWEEHEDLGGMVLEHANKCYLYKNTATNVWSGLTLRYSDNNKIEKNNFSHTSNVGLRMWRSCNNSFEENDFSWGLRKEPNEIHARDSSCVLIETGSNENRFIRNDMRFGGDGLFIRSLNGWMSTGNYFEENDASFANNNAIEGWDVGNTYVRNKANFSSYGFWLGCSDNTILIENEVIYNGSCFKNAPEDFGNAGIAVVNGSGSHFYVKGNKIHNNRGPGIAIRNRADYPSMGWILEDNEIFNQYTDVDGFVPAGIYIKNACNIHLINNKIENNQKGELHCDINTQGIVKYKIEKKDVFDIQMIESQEHYICGQSYTFFAQTSDDNEEKTYTWYINEDVSYATQTIKHHFTEPGFYKLMLNVSHSKHVAYTYKHIFVTAAEEEIGTNEKAELWYNNSAHNVKLENEQALITSTPSIRIQVNQGKAVCVGYPNKGNLGRDLTGYAYLQCFVQFYNEILEWYKYEGLFKISVIKDNENYIEYRSKKNAFGEIVAKCNEAKYTWFLLNINLQEDKYFEKVEVGKNVLKQLNKIEFRIDNPIESECILKLDALKFVKE